MTTKIKTQDYPSIRAYLLQGAFYLLFVVAFCVIPFAVPERNATKAKAPINSIQRAKWKASFRLMNRTKL